VVYSVSPRNCWHSLIIVSFDLTQRELLRPLLNGTPDNTRNCVFNSRTMAVFNSYHSQHSHNLVHLSCSRTVYQCCVFSYTHTHTHARTHSHAHTRWSVDWLHKRCEFVQLIGWQQATLIAEQRPFGYSSCCQTDFWHADELSLHLSAVLVVWLRAYWIRKVHATIQLGMCFCVQ